MRVEIEIDQPKPEGQRASEITIPGLYWIDQTYRWFLVVTRNPLSSPTTYTRVIVDLAGIRTLDTVSEQTHRFVPVPKGTTFTLTLTQD